MKKKIVSILLCTMIALSFGGSAIASNKAKIDNDNIVNLSKELGEKYCICPELLQAIQEYSDKDELTDYNIKYLRSLYEKYEDNYTVLAFFISPDGLDTQEDMDKLVNKILDRSRELEIEHGKV